MFYINGGVAIEVKMLSGFYRAFHIPTLLVDRPLAHARGLQVHIGCHTETFFPIAILYLLLIVYKHFVFLHIFLGKKNRNILIPLPYSTKKW